MPLGLKKSRSIAITIKTYKSQGKRAMITNVKELDEAITRFNKLWDVRPGDPNWEERSELVEAILAYEDEHVYLPPPDPIDAIEFRMEQSGLNETDLIQYIGSKEQVYAVLSGELELTEQMITSLCEGLGIPLESLRSK